MGTEAADDLEVTSAEEVEEMRGDLREFADEITGYMAVISGEEPEEMKKRVGSYPIPPED